MSSDWRWTYLDPAGAPMEAPSLPAGGFPTRADAEAWLGESWQELVEAGVDAVTLSHLDETVYGPMSLHA